MFFSFLRKKITLSQVFRHQKQARVRSVLWHTLFFAYFPCICKNKQLETLINETLLQRGIFWLCTIYVIRLCCIEAKTVAAGKQVAYFEHFFKLLLRGGTNHCCREAPLIRALLWGGTTFAAGSTHLCTRTPRSNEGDPKCQTLLQ